MRLSPSILALGIILLLGAIWQIAPLLKGAGVVINYPPNGSRIVALGDSLTVGVGASKPEHGFIPVLEKRIGKNIANRGVSGNTTADALLRLSTDVLSEKPDIVIILLGGNDYLKRVPKEETFKNLENIIAKIQAEGAVVVLLGIRGGLLADHFDDDFKLLAKKSGVIFVSNVLSGILGEPSLMADEIHPNDRGYEKMVDRVAPSIMGLVASIPKAH